MAGGFFQADSYTDSAGTGPAPFPQSIKVTLNPVAGYTLVSDALGNMTLQPPGVGNVAANDSSVVFTSASSRLQICTPTAPRTYTLPTTGIVAGDKWTFYNQATSSANYITIQSSGGNTVCILPPLGVVTLYTAVATPTTAANWIVADKLSQWVPYTPTLGAGYGTATNIAAFFRIINDSLFIKGSFSLGTAAASTSSISIPTGYTMASAKLSLNNTTSNPGTTLGTWGATADANAFGQVIAGPGTSLINIYLGGSMATTTKITPSVSVSGSVTSATLITFACEFPIVA